MGRLLLLSNFGDGHVDIFKSLIGDKNIVFSYIPSRSELGQIYFERVHTAYQKVGIKKFNYIDIDQNYKCEYDSIILKSDVLFLAGGDDPFIIKNFIKRKYDLLIKKFYDKGGLIIGLCAGASILSQYSIVSDYEGNKYKYIQIIPWGIGINDYMYYSRFDSTCNLDRLKEFSGEYNKAIIAASLESAIIIDDGKLRLKGKALLINRGEVLEIQNEERDYGPDS